MDITSYVEWNEDIERHLKCIKKRVVRRQVGHLHKARMFYRISWLFGFPVALTQSFNLGASFMLASCLEDSCTTWRWIVSVLQALVVGLAACDKFFKPTVVSAANKKKSDLAIEIKQLIDGQLMLRRPDRNDPVEVIHKIDAYMQAFTSGDGDVLLSSRYDSSRSHLDSS